VPLSRDPLLDKLEPLRKLSRHVALGYATAVASVGAAVLVRYKFGDTLAIGTFITFYPAVIVTTLLGRWRPGILSVALSLLAADYFFVPPIYALSLSFAQAVALFLFGLNMTFIVGAISLLHEALDRLSDREQKMLIVLEAAPVGLVAVDDSGTITMANPEVEKQVGYPKRELIGKKIEDLIPERFRVAHLRDRTAFARHPEARAMGTGRELFALRRDGSEVPVEVGLNPIRQRGREGVLATVLDISERKSAEQKQEILIREVQHRARNLLSVIQVIATRVLVPQHTVAESRRVFLATLKSLAQTQDLFAAKGVALLNEIIELEVQPFHSQVSIAGCAVSLKPKVAQDFSLIIHELATNALKYGAFSVPEGRVSIAWQKEQDEFTFSWTESNGPAVVPPVRHGFGRTILHDLAKAFSDDVVLTYAGTGFTYMMKAMWPSIAEPEGSGVPAKVA